MVMTGCVFRHLYGGKGTNVDDCICLVRVDYGSGAVWVDEEFAVFKAAPLFGPSGAGAGLRHVRQGGLVEDDQMTLIAGQPHVIGGGRHGDERMRC